jgi:membrane protein implicated in regulation of membrane protease activity
MKPFVLGRRDKVKIGAIALLGIVVILIGKLATDLVYLPVFGVMAAALGRQWLRGRRPKERSDGARSTGSR